MQDILGISLRKLKKSRVRRMRTIVIMLVLSLVVSLDVFWILRQPGLTLAGDADCRITEHTHDDLCQTEDMTCDIPEHIHTIDCYADEAADAETPLDWQRMFAGYPYTGNLRSDLVGIAKTQAGYTESTLNFQVDDNGIRHGYTRYGAWYGTPYSDWSAMFVSFCLHYAGADSGQFPGNTGAASMMQLWNSREKFAPAGTYDPAAGDLVFFTNNTVGIVADVQNATISVIRGDVNNAVCTGVIPLTDGSISGWGITGTPPAADIPEESIPEESVPEESIPEESVPEESIPEESIPEESIPEESVPEESVPEESVPEESVPEESIPEESVPEETQPALPDVVNRDPLDTSNGPVFLIYAGDPDAPQMQPFTLRAPRTTTNLLTYLTANGGSYFFTLLDQKNQELPKDDNGNYIAQANEGYKITISFDSPKGFLPGTYEYQIPNGLMLVGGAGEFILSDDTNVGSWVVTETGLITLTFNENINSRTDITISATMEIHFPEQDDLIDFDGKIHVTVEPPPVQTYPTVVNKWGHQGGTEGSYGTDPTKLYWGIEIIGNKDSQIVGNIITDRLILGEWSKTQRYTESDIAGGLDFGASANGQWHTWHVSADDPRLIWTEYGWTYKMPQTVICDHCGELELGDDGWTYYIHYSSTPDPKNSAGTYGYENDTTIDGAYGYAWVNFTHGEITGVIQKTGTYVADANGGAFLWEFQATVPGRPENQKAYYHWYIMDYMKLMNGEQVVELLENDAHLASVTATYNGVTIQVPRVQDATENDFFAWDNGWNSTENGINYGREFNLLCRCQCTPETCHWDTGCGQYWFLKDDGTKDTNGFCQCWLTTDTVTFTFVYETRDLSIIQNYGGLGYQVQNSAELFYIPEGTSGGASVSHSEDRVPVPGLFKKELSHDFDGYTANYHITVNESKLVLTNGEPLTIHDVMTETLAFISGSLVITAEDAGGNVTMLQQDVDFTVTYDGTGNTKDENGKPVHILDIEILHPQPVMYTLDYDATLVIPDQLSGGVKYSNSATITLWGETVSDSSTEKVYADINIAAKHFSVNLAKSAEATGAPLAGATFGLFNANDGQISTDVTDQSGNILFQTNITEGIILREHELYYLQELKAPPGYQLDHTKYWFCFCDREGDTCETCTQVMAGIDALRIPYNQIRTVFATNKLMTFQLPATGGSGIYPLMLVSVTFIVTPLVYISIQRRRQERRGV